MWEGALINKRISRKPVIIWITLLILLILSSITVWVVLHGRQQFFPKSIIESSTSFSLYYPTSLPDGFIVDKDSFSRAASVLTFTATNAKKDHLNFSVQQRPANYDFDGFYDTVLADTFKFTTPEGEAAIGKAQGLSVGSMLTDSTWVIVSSSTKQIGTTDIQHVVTHLKRFER